MTKGQIQLPKDALSRINLGLAAGQKKVLQLLPQTFAPLGLSIDLTELRDTRQRPFRSLVSSFKRSLYDEVLSRWNRDGRLSFDKLPPALNRERNYIDDFDFDTRTLALVEEAFSAIRRDNEREWLKFIKRQREIADSVEAIRETSAWEYTILLDRVDVNRPGIAGGSKLSNSRALARDPGTVNVQ